jgi:hypothetical protein
MIDAYSDELSAIGRALAEDADILVYGCHFGQGAGGKLASRLLAALSGADIAASDDLTGARVLGGDWELEVHTGPIETAIALSSESEV